MEFLKVLKRKKLLFLNIFFLLYISINLFTGERGVISNFYKKKKLIDLMIKKGRLDNNAQSNGSGGAEGQAVDRNELLKIINSDKNK